jgi:hypothetical protein
VAGAYGWQPYHIHVPIVLKSGSLNLLEPYGLVQECNGIALAFNIKLSETTRPYGDENSLARNKVLDIRGLNL